MDSKDNQEMEIEAIKAIYSNEIEMVESNYPNIHFKFAINSHAEGVNAHFYIDPFNVIMDIKLPANYPDELPELSIEVVEELFDDARIQKITNDLLVIAQENIGMPMDIIGTLGDELKLRKDNEFDQKLKAEEEEANKKVIGTPVNFATFTEWKNKFKAEMEAKKHSELKAKEAALFGRLTGKQQFLQDSSLFNSDLSFLVAEFQEEECEGTEKSDKKMVVEENLFEDDEDFELPSSDEDSS
uniref:RWD domain-containing protein n=1 Tax=Rhabditophanes sp. KR3021 TaxID=114890 RepID=A0AC35U0E5_9BILA